MEFKVQYVIVVNTDYVIGPFDNYEQAENYIKTDSEFYNCRKIGVTVLQTPVLR